MKDSLNKDMLRHYLHNPLGILGLFITLCYLIAGIVFSVGLSQLQGDSERLPFIYFIICFPLVLLVTFLYLVISHHEKLYSPQDFKDESNFIRLTRLEKAEKLRQEVYEVISDEPDSAKDEKDIKKEVHTLMSVVEEAEKMAVWKIEQIYGFPFQSKVKYGAQSHGYIFDAFAQKDGISYVLDCKYVRTAINRRRLVTTLAHLLHCRQELKNEGHASNFIFTFVLENYSEKRKCEIIDLCSSLAPEFSVYVFDYSLLKAEFSQDVSNLSLS